MKAFRVIESHVPFDPFLQFKHCAVVVQEDVLIFERSPESLDKDVIQSPVYAVHANLDSVFNQDRDESIRRELATLVGIEDGRNSELINRFLENSYTKLSIHGV